MPPRLWTALLALLAALPAAAQSPENFLIIIADDVGVERIEAYRPHVTPTPPPARTPNIDALAGAGLMFTNAWAYPICSPTRAALLTGKLASRTDLGAITLLNSDNPSLDVAAHTTIPQMLQTLAPAILYDRRAIGKWHLGGSSGGALDATHPIDAGFQSFRGSLFNLVGNYGGYEDTTGEVWEPFAHSAGWAMHEVSETSAPVETTITTYATHDTAEAAIATLEAAAEPWLLWVGFNAAHKKFHVPPSNLSAGLDPDPGDASAPTPLSGERDVTYALDTPFADPLNPSGAEMHRAMTEAMDVEIGRIVAAVDQAIASGDITGNVTIFFLADNGTPSDAVDGGFDPTHAKGSLYQLGVSVPFIVRSPHIDAARVGGVEDALVSVTDVFHTIGELAGVDPASLPTQAGQDSISLVEFFDDGIHPRERASVHTERFRPHGEGVPRTFSVRAIRDLTYKLFRDHGLYTELYDLSADPQETNNLLCNLASLDAAAQSALGDLRAAMEALDSDPGCAGGKDLDLDGLCDLDDNCILAPNPDQLDTDGPDGVGNACDVDYDNNGKVGQTDFAAFRSAFGSCDPALGPVLCPAPKSLHWDPRVDHDGSQHIGGGDAITFRRIFTSSEVGPSGVTDDADGDGIADLPPACN